VVRTVGGKRLDFAALVRLLRLADQRLRDGEAGRGAES
jgi:hypothetical protein